MNRRMMKSKIHRARVTDAHLDDVAFEVVAEAIRRVPLDEYIARYEANIPVSEDVARKLAGGPMAVEQARPTRGSSVQN